MPELTPIIPTGGTVISYADLTFAELYFSDRLHVDAWEDATDAEKQKALAMATRAIDKLNFRGEKTDLKQEYQWPRGEQTEVPQAIKDACCELALSLLDKDPEAEVDTLRLTSVGYSGLRTSFKTDDRPEWIIALIPSATAWALLAPYLRDMSNVKMSRT